MGSVIQLKTKINNAYLDLRNSVEHKLELVEDKIKNKLKSDVSLVEKMTTYNLSTGGKRLRALITLKLQCSHLPPSFQNIYLKDNLRQELKRCFPKLI